MSRADRINPGPRSIVAPTSKSRGVLYLSSCLLFCGGLGVFTAAYSQSHGGMLLLATPVMILGFAGWVTIKLAPWQQGDGV